MAKPNESHIYYYDLSRAFCQVVLFSLDDVDKSISLSLPSFFSPLSLSPE